MIKNLILTLFIVLLISCDKKVQQQNEEIIYNNENMSFIFDFPDTVRINKEYNGIIIYKNILDTITRDLSNSKDSIKNRYIIYSLAKTTDLKNSTASLRKIAVDSFGAIDNRTIPIFKIKFNTTGVHFIDGFITDNGYIKDIKKDSIRIITNEFRVAHKVIVVDK